MKTPLVIFLVLSATTLLLTSNIFLQNININLSQNQFLNGLLKYQLFAFCIATVFLILTLYFSPESKLLLKFGNLEILAVKEKWLGINGKTSWLSNLLQFVFFISLATFIFMYFAVKYTDSMQNFKLSFIPMIILISLTNSFSEEIIFRFFINGNLNLIAPKLFILIVSGVLFGIPHYFGFPTGVIGMIMSGVLGYILSKATFESQGIGIAWSIHFIQDMIIFTALFMINTKI